jgi:hypothetical protein
MKYFSIDLEMSGLDPNTHQILEFAAIYEDTEAQLCWEEIPKFERIINYKELIGSPGALNLNARLLKILAGMEQVWGSSKKDYMQENNIIGINQLSGDFHQFVYENLVKDPNFKSNKDGSITINVAGKNFGTFDLQFINQVQGFKNKVRISQRILDPAILYFQNFDERLPNLLDCKKRAGIKGKVTHTAIEDAWDVVEVLRNKL